VASSSAWQLPDLVKLRPTRGRLSERRAALTRLTATNDEPKTCKLARANELCSADGPHRSTEWSIASSRSVMQILHLVSLAGPSDL